MFLTFHHLLTGNYGGGGGANLIFAKGMEVTFIHVYVQERMQKQHA